MLLVTPASELRHELADVEAELSILQSQLERAIVRREQVVLQLLDHEGASDQRFTVR